MVKSYKFLLLFILLSCSTEKVNLSPVSENLENSQRFFSLNPAKDLRETTREINYASELSNLLSSFPKFKNDAVNKEVGQLKKSGNTYLIGWKNYNARMKSDALYDLKKSYKKLQKLKKYLNTDDSEVLNRYLVRIKTTLTMLESSSSSKVGSTSNI